MDVTKEKLKCKVVTMFGPVVYISTVLVLLSEQVLLLLLLEVLVLVLVLTLAL